LASSIANHNREITLYVHIVAKNFEMCILETYSHYFESSDLQFDFKNVFGVVNSYAPYSVRSIVQHFTSSISAVNSCAIDMSKAFDKVNHCVPFIKLLDHNLAV